MRRTRQVVGVLGGLGPAATVDFLDRLVRRTVAERDQDHVHVLVDLNPTVPDRNAAIGGDGPSSGPTLAAMARGLARAGADFLVMPCNAAHAFAADIEGAVSVPFVSLIDVTIEAAMAARPNLAVIGLLAAVGTIRAGVYAKAFAEQGVEVLTPDEAEQHALMRLIARIKDHDTGEAVNAELRRIADGLVARGAEAIVLGCTELPMALGAGELDVPAISSTDALVARTIELAGATLGD